MKIIDINNWKGKKHYLWFKEYAHPYYGITSRMDLTKFYNHIKTNNLPFFATFMYIVTKALNEIEEFRLRIVDNQVVLYDVISPAFTVMTDEQVYENCDVEFAAFDKYLPDVLENIKKIKECNPDEITYKKRYDQFYISCVPWIDILSATNPMTDDRNDSIPRIGWGKYVHEGDKVVITLGIQVNHALIDGYPLSLGFLKIQEMLNDPEKFIK